MNYGEGEQHARKMESLGHERADSAEDADIVILNTCTVVDTTEKRMIRRMNELRASGKDVIVTGCMAKVQGCRIMLRLPNAVVVPPEDYDLFTGMVESRFGTGCCTERTPYGRTAILPIAQGCLGHCTYCITRLARGKLISRPVDELVDEFRDLIDSGVKEILVTAQDTACYGLDIGTDLGELLREILRFDGDYRIRIGMMNPNYLERILDDMIDILKDDRVYRFLHVPVQSGSNGVLKDMKRHYTVNSFLGIINRLRDEIPDISIATDIICGFPGETDSDHQKTIALIRKLRADTVNITRFSVRPGTEAAEMKEVQGNVVKERSQELTEVKNAVEYDVNSQLIGKRFRVLVTENGRPGTMIARTDNYRPVTIEGELSIGDFVDVEITGCASTYLSGKLI
jgi:MiaB-like tRNA modifying enzyme